MRTTLTIDDDILMAAKALATAQNQSVGEIISALARQGLRSEKPAATVRNGIPLLTLGEKAMPVTLETVNQLRDELP